MATDPTHLSGVLEPDPISMSTLITNLMSSTNEQRSQAESLFNQCKQTQPDVLALKLVDLLQSSPSHEIRAMCAILLRKQVTDHTYLWPRLQSHTQSAAVKLISKKVCDTVAELASGILDDLPFQCVTSENARLQESALLMFGQLAQYIGESPVPHLDTLNSVFCKCLASQCLAILEAVVMTELAGTEPKVLRRQLLEYAGETNNYSLGQECLDLGNIIVQVASEMFLEQKHALIGLAQIAKGCSKRMKYNLYAIDLKIDPEYVLKQCMESNPGLLHLGTVNCVVKVNNLAETVFVAADSRVSVVLGVQKGYAFPYIRDDKYPKIEVLRENPIAILTISGNINRCKALLRHLRAGGLQQC